MGRKTVILGAAMLCLSLFLGGGAQAAAPQTTQHIALRSIGGSHVSGMATITYNRAAQRTTVTLVVHGLTPGLHLAHIHVGRCGKIGAVWQALLTLTAMHGGTATSVTSFPHRSTSAALSVNVHGVPGKLMQVIACGNL